VLTGSKRDLGRLVAAGTFREDLFYRLNVIPVHLPPLRERAEDVPLLINHFLTRFFGAKGQAAKPLSPAMLDAFQRYPWPGNVRELENVCERIAQTCICGMVVAGCVPAGILFHSSPQRAQGAPAFAEGSLDRRLEQLEAQIITAALRSAKGNKSKAAALLQIKRSTLGDRIKKLGLSDPDDGNPASAQH
jgi:DNA-binding NtrC family response regulator